MFLKAPWPITKRFKIEEETAVMAIAARPLLVQLRQQIERDATEQYLDRLFYEQNITEDPFSKSMCDHQNKYIDEIRDAVSDGQPSEEHTELSRIVWKNFDKELINNHRYIEGYEFCDTKRRSGEPGLSALRGPAKKLFGFV